MYGGKRMRKKVHITFFVVIILLIVTPSISAMQCSTITNTIDTSKDFAFDDADSNKVLQIKHPMLYLLIIGSMISRNIRIVFLVENAYDLENWPHFEIKHPLLYYRLIMLVITTHLWKGFWEYMSYKHEWNWSIPNIM
jgi:hypothetical protein